ncbi:MAG: hypothetical protein ACREIU_09915 [Planctomycetota bacterium]
MTSRSRPARKSPQGAARRAPLWLRRMDLVWSGRGGERFPRNADEGIRQVAALSALAMSMLRENERDVQGLLERLERAQARWKERWALERERYFRG